MRFKIVLILFCIFGILIGEDSSAYPREEITFSSKQKRNWLLMKEYRVVVTSSLVGKLATIISNPAKSDIVYRFSQATPQIIMNDDSNVFEKINNIRQYKEVFGKIGFPQIASLTKLNGALFGLILTTKIDLEPKAIGYIQTDDAALAEEYYESLRHRTGTSASFGYKFGGIYYADLYDSAVLVKLDGDSPEILKVYDIIKSPLLGYDSTMRIYDVIYEYAYADLTRMANTNLCDKIMANPIALDQL